MGERGKMESVTTKVLQTFLQRFGEQITVPVTIYLLGGSALCLLGSPRETLDVDYSIESIAPEIEQTLERLAIELKLDLEPVPPKEFIPLPDEAESRHRFVGRYGNLEVYIFDLYSIALSKIARGFESDIEDVEFLINQKLISWEALTKHFQSILPRARNADIDPKEFQQYFETLRRKINR
jgi:hypothetical protein